MPTQLPSEIRKFYTVKRVDKKHELGPGWTLKCDSCGEVSHVALPAKGQKVSADLIKHLLDHAVSHTVVVPVPSKPKLRMITTPPKPTAKKTAVSVKHTHTPPKPVKVTVKKATGYYEVTKEGADVTVQPIPPEKHRPGVVEQVGATFVVTVEGANPKHAQVRGEGLIYRHRNPPKPTRSWRDRLVTAE